MTNLDAAPAARASVESVAPQPTTVDGRERTNTPPARFVDGTGDPHEPVAWAVALSDGRIYGRYDSCWEAHAIAVALPAAEGVVATVAPLYRSPTLADADLALVARYFPPLPTLTDAEREAVEFFGKMDWPKQSHQIKARAATLRRLLERTK